MADAAVLAFVLEHIIAALIVIGCSIVRLSNDQQERAANRTSGRRVKPSRRH